MLAIAVLALSPAQATSKLEPPDLDRYLRWGFLRARPGLELSNLGYDNNILLTPEETRVGDYTATLSPKLDGMILFGSRAFLTFVQRFDYTAYINHTDQNFLDNTTLSRLTLPFRSRQIGLFVDAGYVIDHQRPIDLEGARPRTENASGGIGLIVAPGWRTEIELGRRLRVIEYTDDDFNALVGPSVGDRLDRRENGTTLDLSYQLRGRTKLLITGLWQEIEFAEPFTVGDLSFTRDTDEWRAMAGLEFGEGGPLVGSFRLGWDRIVPRSPILEVFSQPVGQASLRYRLNSRTRFELETERLPGFAVYGANSYYLLWNARFGTIYYFSRLIGIEAGVSAGRLTFPDSIDLLGREDELRSYDLGTRFRLMENSIGRRVEYGFKVRYYDRTSTVPEFDRSATTVGFDAALGF
ncbi:MAG TPA: outer membrane beta-barrel protein [Candidatus Polarisedimenticolaceae bacterium]|nr:outer membrane beta-barrel protein [Candidatus Polarisedimenticolaceae bacterium]